VTPAPRSSLAQQQAQHGRYTADRVQALQQLRAMFGTDKGHLEIGVIAGDPSHNDPYGTHAWMWYTYDTAPKIAELCATLAHIHGDVYITNMLYRKRKRTEHNALPNRLVYVDQDKKRLAWALQPTFRVRTSKDKSHDYYLLPQSIPLNERRELQQLGQRSHGGDPSGTAIVKIVRIAGSTNTKGGGEYPVTFEQGTGHTYTPDELRAYWTKHSLPSSTSATDRRDWTPQERAAFGAAYPHRAKLLNAEGVPSKVHESQAYYAWRGDIPGLLRYAPHLHVRIYREDGSIDESFVRACVGKGLRLRGYSFGEFAALLWDRFESDSTIKHRGATWLEREIAKLWDIYPGPTQEIKVDMRKAGRPHRLTRKKYLSWLKRHVEVNDTVFCTRQEIADKLGVSIETVRRIERQLIKEGLVERHVMRYGRGKHNRSCVTLLGSKTADFVGVSSDGDEQAESRMATPQNDTHQENENEHYVTRDPSNSQGDQVAQVPAATPLPQGACRTPEAVEVVPSNASQDVPEAESMPLPSLRELVHAAVASIRLEEQRVTFKRVQAWFDSHMPAHGYPADAIKRFYEAEKHLFGSTYINDLYQTSIEGLMKHRDNLTKRLMKRSKREKLTPKQLEAKRKMVQRVIDDKIARSKREQARSANQPQADTPAFFKPQTTQKMTDPPPPPLAVQWDYLERMYALGDVEAIRRHCLYRADVGQVLSTLGGAQ
jgi:DNA-binding MarR family transcriptional regulator